MQLTLACIGEVVGTYLLVVIGTGAVAASLVTGADVGLWQVAAIWGVGLSLAIYLTGALSGAHLNPAVTLAFALFRPQMFPPRRLLPYWGSQLAGAVLAGLTTLWVFGTRIADFEAAERLVRGEPGSELSAMIFGEYFPNPALFGTGEAVRALVSPGSAAIVEAFGTAVLAFVVFAVVDRKRRTGSAILNPLLIGLTLMVLIGVFAPLTQAGWNPARDFGPRIVAFFAGWGSTAIPGPSGGFWVYVVGPLMGAPLGAFAYDLLSRHVHRLAPVGTAEYEAVVT